MSEAAGALQEPVTPSVKEDAPEEFRGCARPCWQSLEHTYAHGSCARAGDVPDALDAGVSVLGPFTRGKDGRKQVEVTDIPLIALLPWTRFLPLKERWALLDEVAEAEEPALVLHSWKASADVWRDPDLLEALTAPKEMGDYGEVSRPEEPRTATGLKIYTEWSLPREGTRGWQYATLRRTRDGQARLLVQQSSKETSALLDEDRAQILIVALNEYLDDLRAEREEQEAAEAQRLLTRSNREHGHSNPAAGHQPGGVPESAHLAD